MPPTSPVPDLTHPDLFPRAFPSGGFPAFVWEKRPPDLPVQASTTRTTHQDGQQGGLPLTVEDSLRIYALRRAGAAGLTFLIKAHTGRELGKDHPGVQHLHAELGAEFDRGRQTAVG